MKRKIFLFDLESTGTDTATDRVVQIAFVLLDPETLEPEGEPISVLINPERSIPEGATAIHGITNEMLKGKKTFGQIAGRLKDAMNGCDMAGYNSNAYDVPLLVHEFLRCGQSVPFDENTLFLDVFQIYRKLNSFKLTDVYERMFNEPLTDAHDAAADVKATTRIFAALVAQNHHQLGSTPAEWSGFTGGLEDPHWFVKQNGQYCFSKGKWKGEAVADHADYANWMMGQAMPLNTKATLCRVFGADLWMSINAGMLTYSVPAQEEMDMGFPF